MELFADTIISLAVHAASALEDEQVVNWLIGFQEFSLEQFNNSRKTLGITDPGRRNNLETALQDIVQFLQQGNHLPKSFVIDPKDLFKLPGLSRECLELTNFQLGIELAKSTILKQKKSVASGTGIKSCDAKSPTILITLHHQLTKTS